MAAYIFFDTQDIAAFVDPSPGAGRRCGPTCKTDGLEIVVPSLACAGSHLRSTAAVAELGDGTSIAQMQRPAGSIPVCRVVICQLHYVADVANIGSANVSRRSWGRSRTGRPTKLEPTRTTTERVHNEVNILNCALVIRPMVPACVWIIGAINDVVTRAFATPARLVPAVEFVVGLTDIERCSWLDFDAKHLLVAMPTA